MQKSIKLYTSLHKQLETWTLGILLTGQNQQGNWEPALQLLLQLATASPNFTRINRKRGKLARTGCNALMVKRVSWEHVQLQPSALSPTQPLRYSDISSSPHPTHSGKTESTGVLALAQNIHSLYFFYRTGKSDQSSSKSTNQFRHPDQYQNISNVVHSITLPGKSQSS